MPSTGLVTEQWIYDFLHQIRTRLLKTREELWQELAAEHANQYRKYFLKHRINVLEQKIQYFASLAQCPTSKNAWVGEGDLVEIASLGERKFFFLSAYNDARRVIQSDFGPAVEILQPQSRLSRQLLGRCTGDWIRVEHKKAFIEYGIIAVTPLVGLDSSKFPARKSSQRVKSEYKRAA